MASIPVRDHLRAVLVLVALAVQVVAQTGEPEQNTEPAPAEQAVPGEQPATPVSTLDRTLTHAVGLADVVAELHGTWSMVADPGALGFVDNWQDALTAGEPPFEGAEVFEVEIPGPLEQVRTHVSYDGVVWHAHTFTAPDAWPAGRLRLHFERVNYACRVWLDGEWIGDHEGGYAPFQFDVSEHCKPGAENRLVVMVIDPGATETFGMTLKTTPHAKESWYHNWGGIVGDVTLRVLPTMQIDKPLIAHAPEGVIEARVTMSRSDGEPSRPVEATLVVRAADGAEVARVAQVVEIGVETVLWRGQAQLPHVTPLADATPLAAWHPSSPHLYDVELSVDGRPIARATTGARTFTLDERGLTLNGEPHIAKAVLYQPHHTGLGGMPPGDDALEAEVREILTAGFDMVRVHVAPAEPAFLDAADRLGLLVLEEPAIGWVDDDPALLERLESEVRWMVERDQHRACIVMWGVLNELSGTAYRYAAQLMDAMQQIDLSRPILEDSGGFFRGGRYWPAFHSELPSASRHPMVDEHYYPPYPLPPDEWQRLANHSVAGAPTFASEFGYGALLDAPRANTGFADRKIWSDERILFAGMRGASRRARKRGDGWAPDPGRAWIDAAQQLHADAAEDLIEALRVNPNLALLCYTQWRAVSKEPSAGVLAPWGERRPVFERLRAALSPLAVVVEPQRSSWRPGEKASWNVHVINDTRETLEGELAFGELGSRGKSFTRNGAFAPGITTVTFDIAIGTHAPNMTLEMAAVVATEGFEMRDESVVRSTPVVARRNFSRLVGGPDIRPVEVRVWVPDDHPDALDFIDRAGFSLASPGDGAHVVMLVHPQDIASVLTFAERMRVWHFVRNGGVAIVLGDNPAEVGLGRLLGAARGVSTLAAFPVDLHLAPAAGNFMGRVHVARRHRLGGFVPEGLERNPREIEVALMGRGDEMISPTVMVAETTVENLRAAIMTLSHLGDERGMPLVDVPYGTGIFRFVGLPLLEPLFDEPDAYRERVLAELMTFDLGQHLPRSPAKLPKLPGGLVDALAAGSAVIEEAVALGDRLSPTTSAGGRPALADDYRLPLLGRNAAIAAALDGRPDEARALIEQAALSIAHREFASTYVTVEERLLRGLEALSVTSTDLDVALADASVDWDLAVRILEHWTRATVHWTRGEHEVAIDWLGRAELMMIEAKGAGFPARGESR